MLFSLGGSVARSHSSPFLFKRSTTLSFLIICVSFDSLLSPAFDFHQAADIKAFFICVAFLLDFQTSLCRFLALQTPPKRAAAQSIAGDPLFLFLSPHLPFNFFLRAPFSKSARSFDLFFLGSNPMVKKL